MRVTAPEELIRWSSTDQYPGHWGARLAIAIVTSRLRECEYGYRTQYVDMLSELREADGHTSGALSKIFSTISCATFEITPATVDDEADQEPAKEIAEACSRWVNAIPQWRDNVRGMLWGFYHGASARELMWTRRDGEIVIDRLHFVHSRRVCFDSSFRPYATDGIGTSITGGVYLDDYPGRFFLFTPKCCDEYPTREGWGRLIAYYMAAKRFSFRNFLVYTERFGMPFPIAKWRTGRETTDATPADDITAAKSLVLEIGRGSQAGAALPDTIELDLLGNGAGKNQGGASGDSTPHKFLEEWCNSEISKAIVTATLTSEPGVNGNRSLGDRQGDDQDAVVMACAKQFDQAVTDQILRYMVKLNFGDQWLRLCPTYHTQVEAGEDHKLLAEVVDLLVKNGAQIPQAIVQERFGIRAPLEDEELLKGAAQPSQLAPVESPSMDITEEPENEVPEEEPVEGEGN